MLIEGELVEWFQQPRPSESDSLDSIESPTRQQDVEQGECSSRQGVFLSPLSSSIQTLSQSQSRVQIGMTVARNLNQELVQILDTIIVEGGVLEAPRSEWDLLGDDEQYVPGDNEDGEC